MRSPVTQADWSEARNSATRAISSGRPSRPMGSVKPNAFADSQLRPPLANVLLRERDVPANVLRLPFPEAPLDEIAHRDPGD